MSYFIAQGRALCLPPTHLKWVRMAMRSSMRVGRPGGFLKEGQQLPESFVEFAKGKIESNGESLLANLIADGTVVVQE